MKISLQLDNEDATSRLGEDLAFLLKKSDIITLHGDLGSGKSTLARALIRTIADDKTLEVPSPTFTLVQIYDNLSIPVTHADLYRVSTVEEIEDLGLTQDYKDGILLVEWPEKVSYLVNRATFSIFLSYNENGRLATIKATEESFSRLKKTFFIRDYLNK